VITNTIVKPCSRLTTVRGYRQLHPPAVVKWRYLTNDIMTFRESRPYWFTHHAGKKHKSIARAIPPNNTNYVWYRSRHAVIKDNRWRCCWDTDEWDAAADDHDDDERLEPLVIDEFMREAAQRPPPPTCARCQRRLPAGVLPAPACRTAVIRVLDGNHRHIRHRICTVTTLS